MKLLVDMNLSPKWPGFLSAAVEKSLFIWKDTTADFADCLIGAKNRRLGCRATATFDVKAARLPGFITA